MKKKIEFVDVGGVNELVPMTRRYPKLASKVLKRDSKIAWKIVRAWDIEKDKNKVLSIFQKENTSLSDERYWEILRTVWILCGSVDNVNLFRHYFASKRPQKHYFSTPEEAKRLREMPDEFKVYRATNAATLTEDSGISWTLSYEYAVWYRDAYHKKFLQERLIDKPQVFALIERNKEEEIIIL